MPASPTRDKAPVHTDACEHTVWCVDAGSERLAVWQSAAGAADCRALGLTCVLTALALLFCAPRTFRALHATRTPHRDAGEWLAQAAAAEDKVLDTRCLSALYSGRETYSFQFAKRALRMMRYGAWLQREARTGRFHYLPATEVATKLAAAGFEAIEHRLSYARQAFIFRAVKPASSLGGGT